jgi:hypothetical protein
MGPMVAAGKEPPFLGRIIIIALLAATFILAVPV